MVNFKCATRSMPKYNETKKSFDCLPNDHRHPFECEFNA